MAGLHKMMQLEDTNFYILEYDLEPAEDAIAAGSDVEDSPMTKADRIRRRHEIGRAYLRGHVPFIQSAQLKGPFDRASGWVNPWRHIHKQSTKSGISSPVRNEGHGSEGAVDVQFPKPAKVPKALRKASNDTHIYVDHSKTVRISDESLGGEFGRKLDEGSSLLRREDQSNTDILNDGGKQADGERLGKSGSTMAVQKQTRKRSAESLWLKGGHASKQPRINPPQYSTPTPSIRFGIVSGSELGHARPTKSAKTANLEFCTPKQRTDSDSENTPMDWDGNMGSRSPASRLLARHDPSSPLDSHGGRGSSVPIHRESQQSNRLRRHKLGKSDILERASQLEVRGTSGSENIASKPDLAVSAMKSTSSVSKTNLQFRQLAIENLPASDGNSPELFEIERRGRESCKSSSANTLKNSLSSKAKMSNNIIEGKLAQKMNQVDWHLSTPSGSFQYSKTGGIANCDRRDPSLFDILLHEERRQTLPRKVKNGDNSPMQTRAFSDTESPVTPMSFGQRHEEQSKIGEETQDSGFSWVMVNSTAEDQSTDIVDLEAIDEDQLSSSLTKNIEEFDTSRYSQWPPTNVPLIHSSNAKSTEIENQSEIAVTSSMIRRLSTASTQTQASPPALSPVSPKIASGGLACSTEKESLLDESAIATAAAPDTEEFHTPHRIPLLPGPTEIDSTQLTLKGIKENHHDLALQSPWAPDHTELLTRSSEHESSSTAEKFNDCIHDSTTKSDLVRESKDQSYDAMEQGWENSQGTLCEAMNIAIQSQIMFSVDPVGPCSDDPTFLSTECLLDATTVNPWNSASKHSRSGKWKKRVSFGPLPNEKSDGIQDSAVSQPTDSPPPPAGSRRLCPPNDKFHWKLKGTRALAYAEVSDAKLPNVYQSETEFPQRSPATGAMAAAFLAADRENACNRRLVSTASGKRAGQDTLTSGPDVTEDLQTKLPKKNLLKSNAAGEGDLSPLAAAFQIDHIRCGLYGEVDVDAVIDDMGAYLDCWDVEAEVRKVEGAKSGGDQSLGERRRDYLSSLANR